jgi:ankyrin repeat protein
MTRKDTVLCAVEAGHCLKQVPDNFHTALAEAAARGYAHIVKALLTVDGINPNFGGELAPPLIHAVKNSDSAIVKMLLAAVNINPNVRDEWGKTPLQMACSSYRLTPTEGFDIIKLFLAHPDVDINFQASGGCTALMYAVCALYYDDASYDIIKLLLDQEGIDVNIPNDDQQTPLFIACAERSLPMVDLLLKKKGVNPNAKDNSGCTPLAHVCGLNWDQYRRMNIEGIVELLLSHPDTDPWAIDNGGASILDKSLGNKSLPGDTCNTILGLLQAHPRYQQR